MSEHWVTALERLSPCADALVWAREQQDYATAWATCQRGDWMLWLAAHTCGAHGSPAHRRLVLAACACARLALVHVPAGEDRPRLAIEAAERWVRGEETYETLAAAWAAAWAAARAAAGDAWAAAGDAWAAAGDAEAAAEAAAAAAGDAAGDAWAAARAAAEAAAAAAGDAAGDAWAAAGDAEAAAEAAAAAAGDAAAVATLARCADIVREMIERPDISEERR